VRQPRQLGDVDPVGPVGDTGNDLVEEDDGTLPFLDLDCVAGQNAKPVCEFCEFMVVGGEQGSAADPVVTVIDTGLGR
jgi:hypothetical protein